MINNLILVTNLGSLYDKSKYHAEMNVLKITYQVISDITNIVKLIFNLKWDISWHAKSDTRGERSSFAKVDEVFDGEGHRDSLLQFDSSSIILLFK